MDNLDFLFKTLNERYNKIVQLSNLIIELKIKLKQCEIENLELKQKNIEYCRTPAKNLCIY